MECHRGTAIVPAGEGLSEELVFPHADQKRLIPPEVFLYHIDGSRKDDANVFHIFLLEGDDLAFAENGRVIAAGIWGKAKTVVQMIMCILLIMDVSALSVVTTIAIYAALILTFISLVDYIVHNLDVLSDQK